MILNNHHLEYWKKIAREANAHLKALPHLLLSKEDQKALKEYFLQRLTTANGHLDTYRAKDIKVSYERV